MSKIVISCGVAVAALSWSAPALAQDEDGSETYDPTNVILPIGIRTEGILVRANRDDDHQLVENYTGSATIIERRDIEDRQVRDIADVLRDVPGVAVSSVAGQTQIRLRGSEANHVLVLVDGIEVSDPFAGEFDIGTLQAEIGSRVEVLRGPQSALYGQDAIGGVVAYESAGGHELDGIAARIEGGFDSTFNASARLGLGDYRREIAISGTAVSTDGQPNARGGTRDIGRDSYTLSGKGRLMLSDGFELRGAARYIRTEGDFNDASFDATSPDFGLVVDSPGTRFENDAIYALIGARAALLDDRWTHDLSAQIADITRDSFNAFGRSSGSEGDRLKASYVTSVDFDGTHFVTFAADWERERFRNNDPFGFASTTRQEIESVGLVGEYRYTDDRFDFSAALRHDINDRFADETTFRVGAGFDVTERTRLRASAGSGVKNPGFFELFGFFDGQFIGNEDLRPEKATSWEIGVDQQLAEGAVTLSATWFASELEDEIFTTFPAPDFIATPANRTTLSDRSGLELSAQARLGAGFTLDAAYSFIDAEEDGEKEVRRPDHIASAALNWRDRADKANVNLVVRYNGMAEDLAFTDPSFIPVRVQLNDYVLINLNADLDVSKQFSVFGRVENLLDETYEQVFSFVSPGRTAVVGVSARF